MTGSWPTLISILLAFVAVATVYGALRYQARWLLLLPAAIVLVPQWFGAWATHWHGFLHASIVYEIFERGVPPENPLMLGEPLLYPYGHHVLLAWLMQALPMSPARLFALTDVVCLAAFAFVVDRIAVRFSPDPVFRVLALVLAVVGPTPFVAGPVNDLLEAGPFLVRFEWRYMPLSKFVGINNNQIGLVFMALALLGLLKIASGSTERRAGYLCLAIAVIASAFIYPLSWLGIVGCVGLVAIYFVLSRRTDLHPAGWWCAAIVAVCSAAALPFLLSIAAGKSGDAAIRLPDFYKLFINGLDLIALLALPVALAWFGRRVLLEQWQAQPHVFRVIVIWIVSGLLLFPLISITDHTEYKLLQPTVLALSLPMALVLRELYVRTRSVALLVLFLIVLPAASEVSHLLRDEPVSDRVVNDGRLLRHRDATEDELYSWILSGTEVDAVFIDTYLTVPALAHRQLLIGLDDRRQSGVFDDKTHDGWLLSADELLRNNTGVDPRRLDELRDLAHRILARTQMPVSSADVGRLRAAGAGRSVYIVARDPVVRGRLSASRAFKAVFSGKAATIYTIA